jgi:hypothetical protein
LYVFFCQLSRYTTIFQGFTITTKNLTDRTRDINEPLRCGARPGAPETPSPAEPPSVASTTAVTVQCWSLLVSCWCSGCTAQHQWWPLCPVSHWASATPASGQAALGQCGQLHLAPGLGQCGLCQWPGDRATGTVYGVASWPAGINFRRRGGAVKLRRLGGVAVFLTPKNKITLGEPNPNPSRSVYSCLVYTK